MTTTINALPVTPAEARALLAAAGSGEAVMIRRAIEEQPPAKFRDDRAVALVNASHTQWAFGRITGGGPRGEVWPPGDEPGIPCPWKPGDVLDVLEPWALEQISYEPAVVPLWNDSAVRHIKVLYESDMHRRGEYGAAAAMPREFVRLTLTVTSTSLARSDAGAWAWGISCLASRKGIER